LPCPSLLDDGGEFDGEDDAVLEPDDEDELVDDDQDPPLLALLLPELWLPLASLIRFDALLNAPVVASLSAPMAMIRLPTSISKRMAYSGAETPASSLTMRRNILVLEPPTTRSNRAAIPRAEEAIFDNPVSR